MISEGEAEARWTLGHPLPSSGRSFDLTTYYNHFLNKKCDMVTLKCNAGKYYQNIDQVRKLLRRSYESIVLVGSPTNGQHWHAICSPSSTKMRVRKHVHYTRHRIGTLNVSRANRKRGNIYDDPSINELISNLPRTCPQRISPGMSYKEQLSSVLCYLYTNLLENPDYSMYGHLYVRLP